MGNEFTIPETLIVGSKAAFGELERLTIDIANEIEAVNDTGSASIGIIADSAGSSTLNFGDDDNEAGQIIFDHTANQLQFKIGGTTLLSIDALGTTIGDLIVPGTTTTINTTNLEITDNKILLNDGEAGDGIGGGTGFSGLEIDRGTDTNSCWVSDETNEWWEPRSISGGSGSSPEFKTIGNLEAIDTTTADNILTINGSGAIKIPVGNTAARPSSPVAGMFRFNPDTTDELEYYNGTIWEKVVAGAGGAGDFVNVTGDTMTGTLAMSGGSADITLAGGSISGPAIPLLGDEVGDRDFNDARYLLESNNLSDLTNVATALINLGIDSGGGNDIWVDEAGDTMTGDLIMAADILPDGDVTRDIGQTDGIDGNVGNLRFRAIHATTFHGTATAALYSDLAERYAADMDLESGTVVVFGGEAEITMSFLMEDTAVAGVISTAPAFRMNSEAGEDKTHPYVALKGRVPCKVTGPIKKGDLLITATLHGHAMSVGKRARPYTAFARALENFDGGTGVIEVAII